MADTGIGIAPEQIPYVFDRFFRANEVRSRDTGGTGLGLSIAKAICHAHGGSNSFLSTEGVGTVVRIELPITRGLLEMQAQVVDSQLPSHVAVVRMLARSERSTIQPPPLHIGAKTSCGAEKPPHIEDLHLHSCDREESIRGGICFAAAICSDSKHVVSGIS